MEPSGRIYGGQLYSAPGMGDYSGHISCIPANAGFGQLDQIPWNEFVDDSLYNDISPAITQNIQFSLENNQLISQDYNHSSFGNGHNFNHIPFHQDGRGQAGVLPASKTSLAVYDQHQLGHRSFQAKDTTCGNPSLAISQSALFPQVVAPAYDFMGGHQTSDWNLSNEGHEVPFCRPEIQRVQYTNDTRQTHGFHVTSNFESSREGPEQSMKPSAEQAPSCNSTDDLVIPTYIPRSRFTQAQRDELELWFTANKENPYPNKEALNYLARTTGLGLPQIRNWFSRARQRKLPHVATEIEVPDNQHDDQELVCLSLMALATSTRSSWSVKSSDGNFSNTYGRSTQIDIVSDNHKPFNIDNKLEWWLTCLPSEALTYNPAHHFPPSVSTPVTIQHPRDMVNLPSKWRTSAEAVAFHTKKVVSIPDCYGTSQDSKDLDREEPCSVNGDVSENGVSGYSGNSAYSKQSGTSNPSSYSAYSSTSHGPRKGRRRIVSTSRQNSIRSSSGANKILKLGKEFVCNFCGKRFSRSFACTRHINAIHNPRSVWVCRWAPHVHDGDSCGCMTFMVCRCRACDQPNEHCIHNMHACCYKLKSERTYFRRDAFVQHLMGVHHLTRAEINNLDLRHCEERTDDTQRHFTSSTTSESEPDDSRAGLGSNKVARWGKTVRKIWAKRPKASKIIRHII